MRSNNIFITTNAIIEGSTDILISTIQIPNGVTIKPGDLLLSTDKINYGNIGRVLEINLPNKVTVVGVCFPRGSGILTRTNVFLAHHLEVIAKKMAVLESYLKKIGVKFWVCFK